MFVATFSQSHPLELGPFTQLNEKKEPDSLAGPLELSENVRASSGATSQSVPLSLKVSVPSLISVNVEIPGDLGPSSTIIEKLTPTNNHGIL